MPCSPLNFKNNSTTSFNNVNFSSSMVRIQRWWCCRCFDRCLLSHQSHRIVQTRKYTRLSLRSPTWSDGGQLSGSADPQTDETGHLIRLLPSTFPQLEPLRGRRVLHRPGQHHLAHELVLHRVAVPHLRKSSPLYKLLLHLSHELNVSFSSPLSSVCSSYHWLP